MSERSKNLAHARTIRERWERSEMGRAQAYIYLIREPRKPSDPKFFTLAGSLPTLPNFFSSSLAELVVPTFHSTPHSQTGLW